MQYMVVEIADLRRRCRHAKCRSWDYHYGILLIVAAPFSVMYDIGQHFNRVGCCYNQGFVCCCNSRLLPIAVPATSALVHEKCTCVDLLQLGGGYMLTYIPLPHCSM